MKLGYHDVEVVSYTAGPNQNGTKVMEVTVQNDEEQTEVVSMYFASPESIRISLEQLRELGWAKNHPKGLDAIIGAPARIEVLEEPFEDRKGNKRMTVKARWAMGGRRSSVQAPISKSAAHDWLASMDKTNDRAEDDDDLAF